MWKKEELRIADFQAQTRNKFTKNFDIQVQTRNNSVRTADLQAKTHNKQLSKNC
jgi:hypothetical protein